MKSVIQILATVLAAVSCSFIQIPSNQIQSALNSTLLVESERLFKPIYIPNIVKYSEESQTTKIKIPEARDTNTENMILKNSLQSEEISQKSKVREDDLDEEGLKRTVNHLKFSSRYSTNQNDSSKEKMSRSKETEKPTEEERIIENSSKITETLLKRNKEAVIPTKSNDTLLIEQHKTFSSRSDNLDNGEEESEELTEIPPTTKQPKPTSFRRYSDEDFDNEGTMSAEVEETEDSRNTEKEAEEIKSSVDDYYNSGSKNYHSIQTPLEEIKYRGRHSFKGNFEPETIRTRLVGAISRRPASHNWPYSKSQMKEELENEISDGDESYEKILDEGVKEEVKKGRKQLGLELAVEKDEFKFDKNKKYNEIDERNRRKQQQKSLSIEEAKDDKLPLFQSLKQYQVNENESNNQPKASINEEGIRPTKSPLSEAFKNIFKVNTPSRRQPKNFNISNELKPSFQSHRFLGPIVFDHNLRQATVRDDTKLLVNTKKPMIFKAFSKELLENEKLDQDKLTNKKIQNSLFENGSKEILSFNHLEENEEMYNAILANIRSVFGVRIQPGKSSVSSQKEPVSEIKLGESKTFTWSLPFIKREKINYSKQKI